MKNFYDLIAELGEYIGEDLKVDSSQACFLEINHKFKVQLELDPPGEKILILSKIIELPPGKFRENVLKDALKANFLAEEKIGALSYLERDNVLVLSCEVLTHAITKEVLHQTLLQFIKRVELWHQAIESGRPSPDGDEIPQSTTKKGNMLGFR